uniref:Uncharacterized protein n=1 Tax=Bos indicus x Bos taurus TaxID=30522 RepID=A0A4W2H9U7_BOBOX
MLARLLKKSADSRVPASFAEPREPAASRRCHCARIQGQSSSAGWRLLSGTVRFVVTSMETERPTKAATAHLPRSWEVRNRYTEEGGQTSQLPEVSLQGENWLHALNLLFRSSTLPGS